MKHSSIKRADKIFPYAVGFVLFAGAASFAHNVYLRMGRSAEVENHININRSRYTEEQRRFGITIIPPILDFDVPLGDPRLSDSAIAVYPGRGDTIFIRSLLLEHEYGDSQEISLEKKLMLLFTMKRSIIIWLRSVQEGVFKILNPTLLPKCWQRVLLLKEQPSM